MSVPATQDTENFSISARRLRLLRPLFHVLKALAVHLRAIYGEKLLYTFRESASTPGIRRWFDAYAMAMSRAERAEEFKQQLLIMDAFYKELLTEAFDQHWLRKILESLQKDETLVLLAYFERDSGKPHYAFPTLTEVNTVQLDARTSRLLEDEFSDFEVCKLTQAIRHRAENAYFDGILFKGKPLAFKTRSMFDRSPRLREAKPEQTSWLTRFLSWFTSSQPSVA